MKILIKMIKEYFISRDMWKARMNDPIIPRQPTDKEMRQIKRQGYV